MIDKIKIFYRNFKINYLNEIRNDEDTKLQGQINYQTSEIKILNTINIEEQKATLLHEIIHGIDQVMNLDLDEKQVDNLSHGLMTILIDNQDFLNLFKLEEKNNGNNM